jgi:hypothetical protein
MLFENDFLCSATRKKWLPATRHLASEIFLSHQNKINLNEKFHILQEEKKWYGPQLCIQ